MAWFSFLIVLFLAMVMRRQCKDGLLAGTGYNDIGGFVGGLGLNVIAISFLGSGRWGLMAGLIGIVIGGFAVGYFLSSEGED
jgi:hypothetical protein